MAAIDVPDNNQSDATSIATDYRQLYAQGLPVQIIIIRAEVNIIMSQDITGLRLRAPPICLSQYRSRFMCIHTFVHGQHLTLPLHVHPAVIFILLIKAAPKLHGCINHRLSITYDWFYMGLRCHNCPCTGMHFNEPGYPFRNLNNSELQNHAKASLRQLTLIPLDRSPHQGTW